MQYMRKITTCVLSQGHQVLPKWDIKELYSCRCGVVVSAHDAHTDGAGLYPDSVIPLQRFSAIKKKCLCQVKCGHVNLFRRLS